MCVNRYRLSLFLLHFIFISKLDSIPIFSAVDRQAREVAERAAFESADKAVISVMERAVGIEAKKATRESIQEMSNALEKLKKTEGVDKSTVQKLEALSIALQEVVGSSKKELAKASEDLKAFIKDNENFFSESFEPATMEKFGIGRDVFPKSVTKRVIAGEQRSRRNQGTSK